MLFYKFNKLNKFISHNVKVNKFQNYIYNSNVCNFDIHIQIIKSVSLLDIIGLENTKFKMSGTHVGS